MLSNEFKINKVDKYIYIKNTYKSYVIACLYIGDMVILNINDHMINLLKRY
jgi:hypothetical protein